MGRIMLGYTLQGMEIIWCFWYLIDSQSSLDHRQEIASPELPSLLWCLLAGPAAWTLVFGGSEKCWLCGPGKFLSLELGVPMTA